MNMRISTLVTLLLMVYYYAGAQFVREYNPGVNSNLVFTCIAKAQNGNYFISGLQDTSVYVSEIMANGNVIREKLIGTGNNYYRLASMIVDADGNIVIAGVWRNINGGILHAFIMKVSPMLSLISFITYNHASATNGLYFSDIKDFKTNGSNSAYYVVGRAFGDSGWNAILMKIDRGTGAVIATFHGRPAAAKTPNQFQDDYSSLLLDTAQTTASPGAIYVSAPLNSGSAATNRPWLVKHNINNLSFSRAEHYIRDIQPAQTASLYDAGLAKDSSNLVACWYGSPNTVSNTTHTAIGLVKANAGTLVPVWQKAYMISPAAPLPYQYRALTKVESDKNGYLARGVWTNGFTESGGDIFFIRTDKNGNPVWAKQYKNVSCNQSFNSSFIIDGANILAVGFRTNSGNNKGILIVMPLATGAMDTACATPLNVSVADSSYAKNDPLQSTPIGVQLQNNYYPVNCVTTTGNKPCNGCKANPVSLNAQFTLTGQLVGNATLFTLTASAFNTSNNSQFVVSQVNGTLADIPGTTLSVPSWGGPGLTTGFDFYQGTGVQGTNTPGKFIAGFAYRVRHIVSTFNSCGVLVADTASKLVYMAQGLVKQGGNGLQIIDEGSLKGNSSNGHATGNEDAVIASSKTGKTAIFPNPANAFVVFNTEALAEGTVELKIVNAGGQVVVACSLKGKKQSVVDTHLWTNGLYLYNISSNGKSIAQGKFVVQH